MRYYPVFLRVENRSCLVVGGGQVGARKVQTLVDAGARVSLISAELVPELEQRVRNGEVKLLGSRYESHHLQGCLLVIAATNDNNLNKRIARDAEQRGVLCNVVDLPEHCSFILPAFVQRGSLTLAVSTAGQSPALARKIRLELEEKFGEEYGFFLELMGAVRQKLLAVSSDSAANKKTFEDLVNSELLQLVKRKEWRSVDALLRSILGEQYSLKELEIDW
ncbi:MAG: bifunctional precorrin-2 dehydrogenase/sirohydrochlorin ferrochelatase [Deltaproteobacteria bacterium]|nr:bifunctional precorrin-2 dehydrogenase/sirohydrochlorin ferrochelatase [Deltaproteobacteria bacterium]